MAPRVVRDLPYTDECRHYCKLSEVPHDLRKYWHQRYSIFSLYDSDEKVLLTNDAWFGVTPEPVARKIAQDLTSIFLPHYQQESTFSPPSVIIIDLFAGVGGNTIQFALSPASQYRHVVAIEYDSSALACAQHNAEVVYGCDPSRITWVLGDCFEFLSLLRQHGQRQGDDRSEVPNSQPPSPKSPIGPFAQITDLPSLLTYLCPHPSSSSQQNASPTIIILFGSPPWGGVSYNNPPNIPSESTHPHPQQLPRQQYQQSSRQESPPMLIFNLESQLIPYSLSLLHRSCAPYPHALYLPRTSDLRQIAALLDDDKNNNAEEVRGKKARRQQKIDVVQYCVRGAAKALVAYVPGKRIKNE